MNSSWGLCSLIIMVWGQQNLRSGPEAVKVGMEGKRMDKIKGKDHHIPPEAVECLELLTLN